MDNNRSSLAALAALLLAVMIAPAAVFAQEAAPEHGIIELGVRGISGEVDGRPDLSVRPSLFNSKLNEYRDLKNGVFVRSLQGALDLGANSFVSVQSRRSILNDQSWLATGGRYGKYKVQFLYEETPHTFTNTARMLFTTTGNGIYQLSPGIRTQLFAASNVSPSLSSAVTNPAVASPQAAVLNPSLFIATNALVPTASWVAPSLIRKSGTGTFGFNFTPAWDFKFQFSRERATGTRPLGVLIGGGTEVPEPIDYTTNKFKVGTEYAQSSWGFQVGYEASQFNNDSGSVTVVNPYSPAPNSIVNVGQVIAGTTQCASGAVAPACVAVATTANGDLPATRVTIAAKNYTVASVSGTGRMSLYPDNMAQNVNFAGRFDLAKSVHVAASVVPGWMSQNDNFLPYTTNLTNGPSPVLPAPSLDGSKGTLAMNYVISTTILKKIGLTAKYRSYDYNNNTPVRTFYTRFSQDQPVPGGLVTGSLTPAENTPFGFNRKTAELAATYALGKKSSAKVGYEFEMMDRQHRDVSSTQENSVFASLDSNIRKDLSLRISYRHSDRSAQAVNYEADDPNYAFATGTFILPNGTTQVGSARRFDEAPRYRERGDALLQYSPLDRLTLSASWGTVQDDYNRRIGNQAPFGVIAGTGAFYTYGLLKDLSTNYGFDATYVLSKDVVVFGEYTREKYFTRMVSQQFSGTIFDTINDWTSQNRNLVDTWATGIDASLSRKLSVSTFYSLSAATGNTIQGGVNCVVGTIACRTNNTHWLLDGPVVNTAGAIIANATTAPLYWGGGPDSSTYGLNFPEAVTRFHQVVAQVRFKISKSLTPKFEYRFEKFDDLNFQTASNPQLTNPYAGGLNPYMYGGVGIDPNSVTGTNKYLFLGADTPSYHAHVFAATLEYRF